MSRSILRPREHNVCVLQRRNINLLQMCIAGITRPPYSSLLTIKRANAEEIIGHAMPK